MANDRPVLLDVTRLIWRRWAGRLPTGIDRVCLAYLDHYRGAAQAVVQRRGYRRILSEAASDFLFQVLRDAPSKSLRPLMARVLARERLYARQLPGRGRVYLNVGHTALEDCRYLDWTRDADVRPVYMVHDIIPITHPEYCRAGEGERHALRVRHMLDSAVGIIGNSQATLDSLADFAAKNGLPVSPAIVAPLGNDQVASARHNHPFEKPTFVMLGTIEARKNHLLILQIWSRLVLEHGVDAPQLMIIGQRGWECEQVIDLLERSEILRGSVTEVGGCGDLELGTYLRSAQALLFPSLVEGYGLPLIEALANGTPVLASDLPVFHEVGAGAPDFIDPLDGPAWQRAIEAYSASDNPARQAQLARLASYRAPTWSNHFAKVNSWLATL